MVLIPSKIDSFDSIQRIMRQSETSEDSGIAKILCQHCGRTSENGIRCIGMCVADNDY